MTESWRQAVANKLRGVSREIADTFSVSVSKEATDIKPYAMEVDDSTHYHDVVAGKRNYNTEYT